MPLDLQPVEEETSSLDLQPVEEAAPIPAPTKPRFSAVGFAPSEFGFSQEPSESELSGASEFLQKPLLNVSPERGRKILETVYPPLRLIKHLPGGQQFEQGVSESAAEQLSGMTAPAAAQYLIPFYGPAALAVGGAEAVGAGAGGLTEAVRQGDIAGAGRNLMNIAGGAAAVLPVAHTAFRSEALTGKPPPEQPLPESEVPSASEIRTPEKVYGPLRALPVEGVREVPVEESSAGVQPQTAKEVPAPAEVLKGGESGEETKGKEAEGVLNDEKLAAESTNDLVSRTKVEDGSRANAFMERAAASKRIAQTLKKGDKIIDGDGDEHIVADVAKDGTVFTHKPGATGTELTGSAKDLAAMLVDGGKIERAKPAAEPTAVPPKLPPQLAAETIGESMRKLIDLPNDAIGPLSQEFKGTYASGLEGLAHEIGSQIKTLDELQGLRNAEAKLRAEQRRAMEAGDMSSARALNRKKQVFTEAIESATVGERIRKSLDPKYQPPIPESRQMALQAELEGRGPSPTNKPPPVREGTALDPNWQVTVNEGIGKVPAQVQIDGIKNGTNIWSGGPSTLKPLGYNVPDFSKLPPGRYTVAEAVKKLQEMEKPESKGTLTYQSIQGGLPKYGMINPKTNRMVQYTAEEARAKGFEVPAEEEAKGKAAMEAPGEQEIRFKEKVIQEAANSIPFGERAVMHPTADTRSGNIMHALGLAGVEIRQRLKMIEGKIPFPTKEQFLKGVDNSYWHEGWDVASKLYDEAKARGYDLKKSKLPTPDQFKTGRAYFEAITSLKPFGQSAEKSILGPKQLPATSEIPTPEAKAQAEVTKVASTEGKRSAAEIKDDLVTSIQERLQKAPSEATPGDKVTIEIPGDGTFTVNNTVEALSEVLARAKKIKTDPGKLPAPLKNRRSRTAPAPEVTPSVPEPSGQALGITPPGFAGIGKLADTLKRAWQGLRTAVRTSPNKEAMAAHMDAADNAARIGGVQMGNRVKLLAPNELDRKAVTFMIEAGDNPDLLNDFKAKTYGRNLDATKAIDHAIANWDRLKPIAAKVSDIMEQQRLFEETSGVDTDFVENYIKHAYDQDVMMGKTRPVILAGGTGTGISTAFRKQRAFDTYADAIAAGYKPKSLDAATLVDSRVSAGTKLVNRLNWGNALRDVVDPTSGKPIVTALTKQPKGTEVAPAGYVTNEIIPGVRVAVHEGYQAIFDALKGKSVIAEGEVLGIPLGQIALKGAGAIKHGLLAFDTFHASRIMQKDMFLNRRLPRWSNGKTLLDYTDADLAEAVKQDLITPEMADYARQNRPAANLLLNEGLNVGRVQEALYADTVAKLPVIGRFNKWVFDKVTRGAMLESGILEFERTKAQNPELSDRAVARKVSKDLNFYFGNVGRQGLFKSKTFQDLMRIAWLAPQWVEGMAQTEVRGFGQLAKAPIDSIRAGQIKAGTLARGVGQGLVAYFLATQLLNLATRKKPTWQNEEKDHKLDAWIPDVTGKTDGYFLSPLSVVAELTHDFIRYASRKDTGLDVAAQIIDNKKAPFARAATVLYTGKDYSGTKILGTWNRIKEAAWSLAPTPIPLQAGIKGQQQPGQMQRQLTASLGIKTEPKYREVPKIVEKYNIRNREGFEGYLNALARESKKLPESQRELFVYKRLAMDGVSPNYRDEAMNKLRFKIRDPRRTVQPAPAPLDLRPSQ